VILKSSTHSGKFLGIVDRIGQGIEERLGLGAVKQIAGLDLERLGSLPADRPHALGGLGQQRHGFRLVDLDGLGVLDEVDASHSQQCRPVEDLSGGHFDPPAGALLSGSLRSRCPSTKREEDLLDAGR